MHQIIGQLGTLMSRRAALLAALTCLPFTTSASEGMSYGAIYATDADAVNQEIIGICTRQFPELARSAAAALANWRSRNAVKAKAAKEAWEAEMKDFTRQAPASEVAAFKQEMADARDEMKTDAESQLKAGGRSGCATFLAKLSNGAGGMEIH